MEDPSIWQILRQEEAAAEEHLRVVRLQQMTILETEAGGNQFQPTHRGTKRPSDGADILAFRGVLCLARSTLSLDGTRQRSG